MLKVLFHPSLHEGSRVNGKTASALTAFLFLIVLAGGGALLWLATSPDRTKLPSAVRNFPVDPKVSLIKSIIGPTNVTARITHVQITDLNGDGRNDLLVCDAARNSVLAYYQNADGSWTERVLADQLKCPAHATAVDLDGDGDRDLVVAVLGNIFPSDELIGKVVWLENISGSFHAHVLLDDVRRVADVQAADLDGDGDVDLAVAVFGYVRGEVLWLENLGGGRFRDHQLLARPGAIHVPIGDLDGDGDLDIATVISQDEEEVWLFENQGKGKFVSRRIYYSANYDAGSAGLVMCDLDKDGDQDLLLPQGDNLEDPYGWPQPYHGCWWLENQGGGKFKAQRIANFGGTYAAAVGDLDGDNDLDIVLVSRANDWNDPAHPSMVWLKNDGHQKFSTWKIDTDPVGLVTVACGHINRDERADVVAGSLNLPPVETPRAKRLTVWLSH